MLLNIKAFDMECNAADLLRHKHDKEPTRSVLYRSAGWLAMTCGMPEQAKTMAMRGLEGNPPDETRRELEQMLSEANTEILKSLV